MSNLESTFNKYLMLNHAMKGFSKMDFSTEFVLRQQFFITKE